MSINNCKEIEGFPNYYVTEDGHIWSGWCGRYISEILTENGYRRVVLSKNNKSHNFLVHRLVAEAFIPNPENKPCVNHKDLNRENNCVENLEWVTYKENNNYADHGSKNGTAHSKRVGQYHPKTIELIAIYNSLKEAAAAVKGQQTNIGACCNNKPHYHTAYGFVWKFIGGDNE